MELGRDKCCATVGLDNVTPPGWDKVEKPVKFNRFCDLRLEAMSRLRQRLVNLFASITNRKIERGKLACITSLACCLLYSYLRMHVLKEQRCQIG